MIANPYEAPAQNSLPESHSTKYQLVRCCVGVASLIYAGWLAPVPYYAWQGYQILGSQAVVDVFNQNRSLLSAMLFAATCGGIAALADRSRRAWLAILVIWVPVALFPVSYALYSHWAQPWEWYGVLVLPTLLLAVLASPFAYAYEWPSRR